MEFELDLDQIKDRIHFYLHKMYRDDVVISLDEIKGDLDKTRIKRFLRLENSYRFKIKVYYENEQIKIGDERVKSRYVKDAIFYGFSSHIEEIKSKLICLELE